MKLIAVLLLAVVAVHASVEVENVEAVANVQGEIDVHFNPIREIICVGVSYNFLKKY